MNKKKALLRCMELNKGLKVVIENFGIDVGAHDFVRDPNPESDIFTCRGCFLTVWYKKNAR